MMLGIWYALVRSFSGSISEYLPAETPANYTTLVLYFVFAVVWLAVLIVTWRTKTTGLLAGALWGLFGVVGAILEFIVKAFSAPDFSDLLFFPISIFGIVACIMTWARLPHRSGGENDS